MLNENAHERRSFRAIGNVLKPIRGWLTNSSMSINSDHHSDNDRVKQHKQHSNKTSLTSSSSTAGSPSKTSSTGHFQRSTLSRPQSHHGASNTQQTGADSNGFNNHVSNNQQSTSASSNRLVSAANYGDYRGANGNSSSLYGNVSHNGAQPHYAPPHMHQRQYQAPQAIFTQFDHQQQQQQQQQQQHIDVQSIYGQHTAVNNHGHHSIINGSSHQYNQMAMNARCRSPGANNSNSSSNNVNGNNNTNSNLTLNQSRAPIVAGDSLTIPPPKPQRMIMHNGTNGAPGASSAFPPPPPPPLPPSMQQQAADQHQQLMGSNSIPVSMSMPNGMSNNQNGNTHNRVMANGGMANNSNANGNINGNSSALQQHQQQQWHQLQQQIHQQQQMQQQHQPNPSHILMQDNATYGTISVRPLTNGISSNGINSNGQLNGQHGQWYGNGATNATVVHHVPERPYSVMGVPGSSPARRMAPPPSSYGLQSSMDHVNNGAMSSMSSSMSLSTNGISQLSIRGPNGTSVRLDGHNGVGLAPVPVHLASAAVVTPSGAPHQQSPLICEPIYDQTTPGNNKTNQNQNRTSQTPTEAGERGERQRLHEMEQQIEQLRGLVLKVLSTSDMPNGDSSTAVISKLNLTNGANGTISNRKSRAPHRNHQHQYLNSSSFTTVNVNTRTHIQQVANLRRDLDDFTNFVGAQFDNVTHHISELVTTHLLVGASMNGSMNYDHPVFHQRSATTSSLCNCHCSL